LISIDQIFDDIIEKTDFLALVMYPTMRARREFVHQWWISAKAEDNNDLKKAVASDPYFALGRGDLLTLLKTKDFETIEFILQKGCKLTVSQDESYKLIAIKKS
jgi:3'-phosphoadenosine 5'-phosphosulfate sulfotransferase